MKIKDKKSLLDKITISKSACGPQSNSMIIRLFSSLIPHNIFFNDCCELHDTLYAQGGTEFERKVADRELFISMSNKAINYFKARNKVGSMFWYFTIAYFYYLTIRKFGKKYFNFKENTKK